MLEVRASIEDSKHHVLKRVKLFLRDPFCYLGINPSIKSETAERKESRGKVSPPSESLGAEGISNMSYHLDYLGLYLSFIRPSAFNIRGESGDLIKPHTTNGIKSNPQLPLYPFFFDLDETSTLRIDDVSHSTIETTSRLGQAQSVGPLGKEKRELTAWRTWPSLSEICR